MPLVFLDILFDIIKGELHLPADKLQCLGDLLRDWREWASHDLGASTGVDMYKRHMHNSVSYSVTQLDSRSSNRGNGSRLSEANSSVSFAHFLSCGRP